MSPLMSVKPFRMSCIALFKIYFNKSWSHDMYFPAKINRRASRDMGIKDGPRAVKRQLINLLERDNVYLSHWIGGEHFTGGAEKKLRTEAATTANRRYLGKREANTEETREGANDAREAAGRRKKLCPRNSKEIAFPILTFLYSSSFGLYTSRSTVVNGFFIIGNGCVNGVKTNEFPKFTYPQYGYGY